MRLTKPFEDGFAAIQRRGNAGKTCLFRKALGIIPKLFEKNLN